ncbi:MAG: aldehyde dehydrogenase family protein [Christensenellales bacterium]
MQPLIRMLPHAVGFRQAAQLADLAASTPPTTTGPARFATIDMTAMVGDALTNDGYVQEPCQKHFDRVCSLILPQKVVFGGKADPQTLRIQPTIMDCVSPDDAVMQQEIFGMAPSCPMTISRTRFSFIKNREHPLALYLFSSDKALQRRVLQSVPFGGGCINDTIIHLATSRMGFGGVGRQRHGQLSRTKRALIPSPSIQASSKSPRSLTCPFAMPRISR